MHLNPDCPQAIGQSVAENSRWERIIKRRSDFAMQYRRRESLFFGGRHHHHSGAGQRPEPGIQEHRPVCLDSGFPAARRPGM